MLKYITFLIVSLMVSYDSGAQNGWNVLNANTTLDLLKVQCLSDDTVFIYGDNGILLISFDGGSTFTIKQNAGALVYTTGFFKNTDTGFVADGGGNIERTADGGSHWGNVTGCTCFINDICFSNPSVGLYSSVSGVRRTSDGGSTWGNTSIPGAASPNKILALNDSVFVSVDGFSFYRSTDYGLSFTSDSVHFLSNYPLNGVSFYDSQSGFVISGDGYLYKTNDQGISWSLISNTGFSNTSFLDFPDSLNGFMVIGSQRKIIVKTVDGGLTWTTEYTASSVIESLSHHGSSVYVCGQGGLVMKKRASLISVGEIGKHSFSLYPNPAKDYISFISEYDLTRLNYKIIDNIGRIVDIGVIQPGIPVYDISFLRTGIYYLLLENAAGVSFEVIRQ